MMAKYVTNISLEVSVLTFTEEYRSTVALPDVD